MDIASALKRTTMADVKKRRVEEPMDQDSGDSGTSVSQDQSTEETGSDASSTTDESTPRKYSRHLIQYPDHEFKVHRKGIHRLGSGSFGDVRKYHHEKLSVVAIKQFYITGDDEKVMKTWDMVLREANILCRFRHQNIVEFLGLTKWTNAVGIVMEHVDGGNLQALLADDNQSDLKWNTRIQIANGLISALSYIHNYGEKKIFCHGDIKPENVLLTKALQVKLADFGSAALRLATGAVTTTLDFVPSRQFTLVYVAPEFLKDTAVARHPAMDMYSFGMVLYELISRRAPYSDCSLPATVPGLILAKIKPTDRLLDNAKSQVESKDDLFIFNLLKDLMKRCWNDDPASRPDSKTVEMELSSYLREITVESLDSTSSDHVIPLMREKLRHAEVTTDVPEKVRCVQTSWIAYHISKSQALIHMWKEEEQTLRDAVADMKKVFGSDVGKENDFLFGRLRDDLDVACERSSQPLTVATRHQYVTETADYDEEQEPDDFYDQQGDWDFDPPESDDLYDQQDFDSPEPNDLYDHQDYLNNYSSDPEEFSD